MKYTGGITLERNLISAFIVTYLSQREEILVDTRNFSMQFSEKIYLECIWGITLQRYLMRAAIATTLSQGKMLLIYIGGLTLGGNHISVAIVTMLS